MKYKILIVDDEPANLRTLDRLFNNEYDVITAGSGAEGLHHLMVHDVALIITDYRMPAMTGIEFLKKAAEMRSSTVRVILTGYTDVDALVESINSGVVYKYITKPWSNHDLQQTVKRAIHHYETLKAQYRLTQVNERLEVRVKSAIRGFVNLATEMLEIKNPKLVEHGRRTAKFASALGKELNMEPKKLDQLFLAAFLHEMAHFRIPNHLVSRTAAPRDDEMLLVQDSLRRGIKLLTEVPELEDIAEAINYQHETYDGNGYPNQLTGDQIPLHSRIIAIVNAYDEMREPTTPTPSFGHSEALQILKAAAGRKFDPYLVSIFAGMAFPDEMEKDMMMIDIREAAYQMG